jgi:redox-sensitive bicupin YhaK (pirin superfamily)
LIDRDGAAFNGGLHPHSGIATLTYLSTGTVNYIDHGGHHGQMMPGSIEWMRAGRGMWHGGGVNAGRMLGFQLWIALPPELELSDPESIYIDADEIKSSGPARVLFGEYAGAKSRIPASMAINYLAVKLQTGESWRYQPPPHHSVLWIAVASGSLAHSESICAGELIIFEPSDLTVTFTANTDVEFVLGSAVPHEHPLALGNYSVHTSPAALKAGEAEIAAIGIRLNSRARR